MSATSTWILCATSRIRHTLHQPCFLAPASHVRNYAFAPTNSRLSPQSNHLTRPPALASLSTPSDHAQAKTWVERFKKEKLLRSDVELQFSRSSGPGGQNVNKLNTKATAKCSVDVNWIPGWAQSALKKSPFYTASSKCLTVSSTASRSQSQNVEDCLSKLHQAVMAAAAAEIKTEPSAEQKERVRGLERAFAARKRAHKDHRSSVKRSRSSRDFD